MASEDLPSASLHLSLSDVPLAPAARLLVGWVQGISTLLNHQNSLFFAVWLI